MHKVLLFFNISFQGFFSSLDEVYEATAATGFFWFKGLIFIIHLSIFPLFSSFLLLLALLQCSHSLLLFLALASFVAALLFVFIFYLKRTSCCTVNFANILLAHQIVLF